jgi:hypothetical protein
MKSSIYTLADQLATELMVSKGVIVGMRTHTFEIEGIEVPVTVNVVSSMISDDGVMVIATLMGNLACAVLAGFDSRIRASLILLDQAKCAKPLHKHIENLDGTPALADVVTSLKPMTVALFHKKKDRLWQEAVVPA